MIVTITFRAAANSRDELVDTLLGILPETRSFDGCNTIIFTESAESPGSLMLVEDWSSMEQYEAYKAWRQESGTSVLSGNTVEPHSVETAYFDVLN